MSHNLRYALRVLLRTPGFTAVALLTLALGIGINTIVFSAYSAVALKPIAARSPEELVRISGTGNARWGLFTTAEFDSLRTQTHSFAGVIASSEPQTVVASVGQGPAEVLRARIVSARYFSTLGLTPALGRTLREDDSEAAVVSHAFWKNRLEGDAQVLGRTVEVRGASFKIVGVAPAQFAGTGLPPQMPDLWLPVAAQTRVLPGVDWLRDPNARPWQVLARRLPQVPVSQASAELEVLGRSWPLVDAQPVRLWARQATFFQADSGEFETFATVCKVLMAAVGLILLIGSVNLVNLLFARYAAREQEFAVRLAMGASRPHLLRQLCTESLLLGLSGGVLGFLLSVWACAWIRVAIDSTLQRITGGLLGVFLDLSPDWHVFAYTLVVAIVTGLAIGLWPAVRASRSDVNSVLKHAAAGSRGGRAKRNVLIGAQVAACLMLLAGAGLLFRGVWASAAIDPGFDYHHVALVGVDLKTVATTPEAGGALIRKVVERIQSLPQVAAISWVDRPPFLGHGSFTVRNDERVWVQCLFNRVSEGYFDTLGIPLLAGRNFTAREIESGAPVMIVSETAARQLWPGKDPLGRIVPTDEWVKRDLPRDAYTVIGVVKSVRSTYLSKPDEPFLYYPKPLDATFGSLMVRTRPLPQSVAQSIFAAIGTVNANLPSQTFQVGLDRAPIELQRLMAEVPAVVSLFLGGLAMLLASLGIFGVVSQLVVQRTREIAIRVSLGAQVRDVARLVIGQTMRAVSVGAAFGLAGAIALSVLLSKMVVAADMPDLTYGAGAFDPWTFAGVLGVLVLVIAVASFAPMRRATRIAPAEALRND